MSSVGHQAGVPLHLGPQLGHVSTVIRVNITFIVTTKNCYKDPAWQPRVATCRAEVSLNMAVSGSF